MSGLINKQAGLFSNSHATYNENYNDVIMKGVKSNCALVNNFMFICVYIYEPPVAHRYTLYVRQYSTDIRRAYTFYSPRIRHSI